MGKASVDPGEIRRFAQDLNRFNNELQTLLSGLHGKMRGLEATWRDQEQRKFAEAGKVALGDAESEVQRTVGWLQGEQQQFWQSQIRKRHEIVNRCKDAV